MDTLSATLMFAYYALQRHFVMLVKPIYKNMCWSRTSSLELFYTLLLLRWGGRSYRGALFGGLYSGIDHGLFYRKFD